MSNRPYIVAEMSASHMGDFDRAVEIVRAAADAGADGVKLQCWMADTMAFPGHRIGSGPWAGRDLADLYREAFTPWQWFGPLFAEIHACGMEPSVSVFDRAALAFMESLDCPRYKIASFEIVDLELVAAAAATGKPLAISIGMATWEEVCAAVLACGANRPTLLKCTSAYPAPPGEANLRTMLDYQATADWGLSDHSPGAVLPIAATALGAVMIEKHLNLEDGAGLDGGFAMTPWEFAEMANQVRMTAEALGQVSYGPRASEDASLALRRSLHAACDIAAGEALTTLNVCTARPADGLHPHRLPDVLGRTAARAIAGGSPITESCLT